MMNLDDLTLGQIKELQGLLSGQSAASAAQKLDETLLGKPVIVRTFSAGCFYGVLSQKAGAEVILKDARRMREWQAAKGLTLQGCALNGIDSSKSFIIAPVEHQWLEAIEIIPCTELAAKTLEEAPHAEAR